MLSYNVCVRWGGERHDIDKIGQGLYVDYWRLLRAQAEV